MKGYFHFSDADGLDDIVVLDKDFDVIGGYFYAGKVGKVDEEDFYASLLKALGIKDIYFCFHPITNDIWVNIAYPESLIVGQPTHKANINDIVKSVDDAFKRIVNV